MSDELYRAVAKAATCAQKLAEAKAGFCKYDTEVGCCEADLRNAQDEVNRVYLEIKAVKDAKK